jgi:HEPN domain-containing protein
MNEQPEQMKLLRQWIAKAEEDLKNAEHTLTLQEECPVGTVCFHAQQCTEKYLKALLLFHTVFFPRTHDLVRLYNLIPRQFRPDIDMKALVVLNRYAVEGRYPGDWEPIDRQEATDAVAIARNVRCTVRRSLPENTANEEL